MAQITKRATAGGEARYDVRTRIDGRVVTKTFRRRKDADAYATTVEADKLRGIAIDPRRSRVTVEAWCREWLASRSDIRPSTRRLYTGIIDKHVVPTFGPTQLGKLTASSIRSWHSSLLSRSPAAATRSYQVLRAALNAAVEDGLIVQNPCRLRRAGEHHPRERSVASVADVRALADAVPPRFAAMILLGYWCSLRLGELRGLRRRDVDLLHRWIDVREQAVDVGGSLVIGSPKTDAGRRRVAIPPHVIPALEVHLTSWVDPEPDAFMFTGGRGAAPLPSATWRRAWSMARKATGLGYTFHDLRHAGNTLAATTGASTRELMARMGHASPRAALIYQHATSERDQVIAAALSQIATPAPVTPLEARDGRAMNLGDGSTDRAKKVLELE